MRLRLVVLLWGALLCGGLVGCATTFLGDAKVPGGAAGCQAACKGLGMELTGMVVLGEYSNGCICQVPGKQVAPAAAAAAAESAAAGVMMQMDSQRPRH